MNCRVSDIQNKAGILLIQVTCKVHKEIFYSDYTLGMTQVIFKPRPVVQVFVSVLSE